MHNIEWSGTLFYSITEGEFGDDKCLISAEYLFLQDIGNDVFTTYEYTPEFVNILMANPALMDMKIGHIHSHHTMSVFFSDTDDKELIKNSEFHNYYLSLIINNANEMMAKVAFRVKEHSAIESKLLYYDSSGNEQSRTVHETVEKTSVHFYHCEISKPPIIDSLLSERFDEIIKNKAAESQISRSKFGSKQGNNKSSKKQGDMWSGWDGDEFTLPGTKGKKGPFTNKQKNIPLKEPALSRSTYSFLVKLLNLDHLYEGSLSATMKVLSEKQFKNNGFYVHIEEIAVRVSEFYISIFPEDNKLESLIDVITEVTLALDKGFSHIYPELTTELLDIFNLEIQ
ncbi:MAG TPA: hypothetical protein VGM30_10410 [Puia sp.]